MTYDEEFLKNVSIFLKENNYWLVPLVITTVFALFNLKTAHANLKIAESQRCLQNNVFCYQLYEKRMYIYTDVNKILSDILDDRAASKNQIAGFLHCTKDVQFLFGKEIVNIMNEIYELIRELHRYSTLVEHTINSQYCPQRHEENCNKEVELIKQISDIQVDLKEYFKPYICFGDFKIESMKAVSK